jgi:cold shock CspA family protein
MNSQPFLSADTATQTLTGRITHYNPEKKYGFIKTENNQSYFFHYDMREQIRLRQAGIKNAMFNFYDGDHVSFQLRPNFKNPSEVVAHKLVYVNNFYREQLKEHAAENKTLTGTLIKKEEEYFIKHPQTEMYIPVLISEWEIDLNLIYNDRVRKTVEFTLTPCKSFKGIRALLTGRKFSEEYKELLHLQETGQIIKAVISGKIWKGLFARLLNGKVYAFALLPKELNEEQCNHFLRFNPGDIVKARIVKIKKNKRVSITIAE